MRHGIQGRKLNRTSAHRKALLMNLAIALIKNNRIKTTLPKAKELSPFVEKLVTLCKVNDLSTRRTALSVLRDKDTVAKLFEISASFSERKGGYTRILKCGFRYGDNAPMALIEFVEK